MATSNLRKDAWVRRQGSSAIGQVLRVARDGSWADVRFLGRSQRLRAAQIEVVSLARFYTEPSQRRESVRHGGER